MAKRGFLLVPVMLLLVAAAWAAGQIMTVQVRETNMRGAPSFTGGLGAAVTYGQQVSVLEERGAWFRVSAGGQEGWLHKNALSDRKLALSSGAQDTAATASEREISMAGKGFSPQVEKEYRAAHPEGYAQVEKMLAVNYSEKDLYAFLTAGKVTPKQEER